MAAWEKFEQARFKWGADPKNPNPKGTRAHTEWKAGYATGLENFFRK